MRMRGLVLLPLLLTACSSMQLKHTEQNHERTMIHVQPLPEKEMPSPFEAINDTAPIDIFRCFAPGDVDGELCRTDVLRHIDMNQLVTVYYVQGDEQPEHWSAEGTLRELTPNNRLKLEEHLNVYLTVDGPPIPIVAFEYINVADIEFAVVDGSGELK